MRHDLQKEIVAGLVGAAGVLLVAVIFAGLAWFY
jgi:hypothetical protein